MVWNTPVLRLTPEGSANEGACCRSSSCRRCSYSGDREVAGFMGSGAAGVSKISLREPR